MISSKTANKGNIMAKANLFSVSYRSDNDFGLISMARSIEEAETIARNAGCGEGYTIEIHRA